MLDQRITMIYLKHDNNKQGKNKMHFKGDKVKLTGKIFSEYGTEWAEFVYLEGHKKGKLGVIDMNHWSYKRQAK